MTATMRSFLPLILGVPAAFASGLVAGFEIGYWRLLPATPFEPLPLPPLARAALWAEFGGYQDAGLPASFPFLAPQIAALMLEDVVDRPRRSSNGLVSQLAKTQLFALQNQGKVSPRLRHPERAMASRNDILARIVETGALDAGAAARAAGAPLAVKLDCNRI